MGGLALIDLAKGHPDPTLLPREALADACEAAASALRSGSFDGLKYGSRAAGSDAFIEELVGFMGRQCPDEPRPRRDCLMLTNGVSHGLELACSVLAKPGEAVLVEAPTYFLAVGIFESHGLEVVPVPTDSDGLIVDAVEAVLDARPQGSPHVRFVYTVPAGHNPMGSHLPISRREALVAVAQRRGLLVLADEVYHMLDWHASGQRPHRLATFDPAVAHGAPVVELSDSDFDSAYEPAGMSENESATARPRPVVMSVGSFTKILAPGLRVGWIEAASPLVARLAATGYLVSGGCVATFASDAVLRNALSSRAADRALEVLKAEYQQRSACLVAALRAASLTPLVEPHGGYFVWTHLGVDARRVLELARQKHGVTFMPGSRCDVSGSSQLAECARLCFALLPPDQIVEGVGRLAAATTEAKERVAARAA